MLKNTYPDVAQYYIDLVNILKHMLKNTYPDGQKCILKKSCHGYQNIFC